MTHLDDLVDILVMTRWSDYAGTDMSCITDAAMKVLEAGWHPPHPCPYCVNKEENQP